MKSILEPYKEFILKSYKNLDFYLERKYNVFLSRINHPSYDKYK